MFDVLFGPPGLTILGSNVYTAMLLYKRLFTSEKVKES